MTFFVLSPCATRKTRKLIRQPIRKRNVTLRKEYRKFSPTGTMGTLYDLYQNRKKIGIDSLKAIAISWNHALMQGMLRTLG